MPFLQDSHFRQEGRTVSARAQGLIPLPIRELFPRRRLLEFSHAGPWNRIHPMPPAAGSGSSCYHYQSPTISKHRRHFATTTRQRAYSRFPRRHRQGRWSAAVTLGIRLALRNFRAPGLAILPDLERRPPRRRTSPLYPQSASRGPRAARRLGQRCSQKPPNPRPSRLPSPGKIRPSHLRTPLRPLVEASRRFSQFCQRQTGMGRCPGSSACSRSQAFAKARARLRAKLPSKPSVKPRTTLRLRDSTQAPPSGVHPPATFSDPLYVSRI